MPMMLLVHVSFIPCHIYVHYPFAVQASDMQPISLGNRDIKWALQFNHHLHACFIEFKMIFVG